MNIFVFRECCEMLRFSKIKNVLHNQLSPLDNGTAVIFINWNANNINCLQLTVIWKVAQSLKGTETVQTQILINAAIPAYLIREVLRIWINN